MTNSAKATTTPETTLTTVTINQILTLKRSSREALDFSTFRRCDQALQGNQKELAVCIELIAEIEDEIRHYAEQKAREEAQITELGTHAGFNDADLENCLGAPAFGMKW